MPFRLRVTTQLKHTFSNYAIYAYTEFMLKPHFMVALRAMAANQPCRLYQPLSMAEFFTDERLIRLWQQAMLADDSTLLWPTIVKFMENEGFGPRPPEALAETEEVRKQRKADYDENFRF